MTANTKIEWADHTFNPWIGCTKVGPGCDHCYAEADFDKRRHVVTWGAGQPRKRTAPSTWAQPVKWNAEAQRLGIRYRVFCASLADVFDNTVEPQWRADLFKLIEATPNLDWLLLTKRIGNAADMMFLARGGHLPLLPNVWIGATIVNQAEADRDIPKLLAVPAAKRFLSMEPLLGPVDLGAWLQPWDECAYCGASFNHEPDRADLCPACGNAGCMGTGFGSELRIEFDDHDGRLEVPEGPGIDWVIVGGESGPKARPMHPDWLRSLRDQCQTAGVPFLFKQWGEWLPWHHFDDVAIDDPPEQTRFKTMEWSEGAWIDVGYPDNWATMDGEIDDMQCVGRVGKKAAGRTLDGRTWDEVPA